MTAKSTPEGLDASVRTVAGSVDGPEAPGSAVEHGGTLVQSDGLPRPPGGHRLRFLGVAALWIALAGGAFIGAQEYHAIRAPGRAGGGFFGPTDAFRFAVGVAGFAMTLVGILIFAVRKQGAGEHATRIPGFTAHAFLCSLGAFFVLLHTGFVLVGELALLTWSVASLSMSVLFGWYVLGWTVTADQGRPRGGGSVDAQRKQLLQRLWAMTDVPPERLEELLSREFPAGELGPLRALEVSLGYQLRPRRRQRRVRAAVDILEVPGAASSEAMSVIAEQWRLQARERVSAPLQKLAASWRTVHVPLGLAASALLAVRLTVLAVSGEPWSS